MNKYLKSGIFLWTMKASLLMPQYVHAPAPKYQNEIKYYSADSTKIMGLEKILYVEDNKEVEKE